MTTTTPVGPRLPTLIKIDTIKGNESTRSILFSKQNKGERQLCHIRPFFFFFFFFFFKRIYFFLQKKQILTKFFLFSAFFFFFFFLFVY
jgi:hypothetical protein